MPATAADSPLTLSRLTGPSADTSIPRPVELVMSAHAMTEGAGALIWWPFPGELRLEDYQPRPARHHPRQSAHPRNYA
jgi:hypothetical protein